MRDDRRANSEMGGMDIVRRLDSKEEERLSLELIQRMDEEERQEKMNEFKKSEDIARKFHHQEEEIMKNISMKMEEENLSCKLCKIKMNPDEIFLSQNCSDIFHRTCLTQYIAAKIMNEEVEIQCPTCNKAMADIDVRQCLTPALTKKYDSNCFKKANVKKRKPVLQKKKVIKVCPTSGCKFILLDQESKRTFFFLSEMSHHVLLRMQMRIPQ